MKTMPELGPKRWPWVLMPGLDGTGELFAPLVECFAKPELARIQRYPGDVALGYHDLLPWLLERVPVDEPCVLVAESFSGPLAVRLAARLRNVRALILCASFVRAPVTPAFGWLARLLRHGIFRIRPPEWGVRRYLVGTDAPPKAVQRIRQAAAKVHWSVFARRVVEAMEVDVRSKFATLELPVLFLWADRDQLLTPQCPDEVHRSRPSTMIRRLDCAHCLLQVQPRPAARIMTEFVRELEGHEAA